MFKSLLTAWKLPDLRKKLLLTFLLLGIYRLGAHIPVPGIDLARATGQSAAGLLNLLDMFAGGALKRMSLFALGVNPYITASIIFQLLTMVIPSLERMVKEGVEGRKKVQQYERYATILLGVVQGWALIIARPDVVPNRAYIPLIVLTFTAGTMFLMWLGEKISEIGIGNGISLLIFIGIVASLVPSARQVLTTVGEGGLSPFVVLLFLVLLVAAVAGIVMVTTGERRIPIQYAKRMVGRRMYGGQTTHLPLRVNQAGVIPVIFASSLLAFPITIASYFPEAGWARFIERFFGYSSVLYIVGYGLLTFVFTFFYTAVTFNPVEVADNMKKYSGFIPGIRPGKPTSEYFERVLTRITLAGALFLTIIAVLPNLTSLVGLPLAIGGTGIIIVVGVALDTMRQIEAQLLMRQYEGFLK